MSLVEQIICSWATTTEGVETTESILEWIDELNNSTCVQISECSINDDSFWFYDDCHGEVRNKKKSFFTIKGIRYFEEGICIYEQPIISQPEIGYLGIVCKEINGVLHFLMQAKIEPGNVNCVQISPTIQATKSNFTRAHGGRLPAYFELFKNSGQYKVVYDQIQSEQAGRFYKKRNRNIIIIVDNEIEILPNYRWMTLGQIKELMDIDNLVNMDTRTVISGLPLITSSITDGEKKKFETFFKDHALFESMFCTDPQDSLPQVFHRLNDFKMFRNISIADVPLKQLEDWSVDEFGITCKKQADFSVGYYDIKIPGREVLHWSQPLIKAIGMATFGLITRVVEGKREFLVKIKPEIGSFDGAEIGPSIQWEPTHCADDVVEKVFRQRYDDRQGIMVDVVLSEEGGRFYHEQNKNVIIEIDEHDLVDLPDDYVWVSYAALNYLIQVNNCLNIQLRNLVSLIKI